MILIFFSVFAWRFNGSDLNSKGALFALILLRAMFCFMMYLFVVIAVHSPGHKLFHVEIRLSVYFYLSNVILLGPKDQRDFLITCYKYLLQDSCLRVAFLCSPLTFFDPCFLNRL